MDIETAELVSLQATKDRALAYWTNITERHDTVKLILVRARRATNIQRRIGARRHRQFHLDLAQKIREEAEVWKKQSLEQAPDREAEIIVLYDKMMTEAMAEENRKCLDGKH